MTVVPNFFDARAVRDRFRYVSLAGITGVATKAAATLMQDASTIDNLRGLIGGLPYYQALIRVAVEHVSSATSLESIPVQGSLEIIDVIPLEIRVDEIHSWVESAVNLSRLSERRRLRTATRLLRQPAVPVMDLRPLNDPDFPGNFGAL